MDNAIRFHKTGGPEVLQLEDVQVGEPGQGQARIRHTAIGVNFVDTYQRSGLYPMQLPQTAGNEGAGVVVDIGPGVTSLKKGDHVIPLYTPECRQCEYCLSGKTNLCQAIRTTQGQGVMPDGSSRFSVGGERVFHYMGTSTFANYTVVPEIALAKIREDAPFDKVCYIGCGVTTGIGAVINTAKVEPGANVVVFGLGGIGLNVIQGARLAGAGVGGLEMPRPQAEDSTLNGLLKGFIDLVVEHGGRYYVVDWKSNWLGDDDDAYHPGTMRATMLEHRYDLQYALYLLALHRQLRARLPGYDYERHVGGAVYAFLRGSRSDSQGLFMDKPPLPLIERLDALFGGHGAHADALAPGAAR